MILFLGILLVFIGIIDIFMTIMYYEGSGFLSNIIQRFAWLLIRNTGLILPLKWRYALFSFAAPLLVTVTLLFWISVEIIGFGLIYYDGMAKGEFALWKVSHPDPLIAGIYLSGVTLPTLGFGDITPVTLFYQITTGIEALIGFAIMTLSLSYIINIYRVIQQFRVLAAELFHETSDTGNAMVLIQNHWNSRLPLYLDSYFRHLQYMLLDWYENLHQYPIAYYYFSSRTQLSIPFTFKTLGTVLSAHYFGTPPTQVFISSPALESLYNSYCSITASMLLKFVHKKYSMPIPVAFDAFKNQLRGHGVADTSIQQFLQLTSKMEQFSGSQREVEDESLYQRYCQWHVFEVHVNQFVNFISYDLGYR